MDPRNREKVGKFLEQSTPIDGCWKETRLAYQLGGHTYLVTDNFPHWNTSAILDFLKGINIKPFEIEVTVTINPVAEPEWTKPTPGYNKNGTVHHSHDWSSNV